MYHLRSIVQRSPLLYPANLDLNAKSSRFLSSLVGPFGLETCLPNTPEFEKASGNAIKT